MKKIGLMALSAAFVLGAPLAQAANEGAKVVAGFMVTPPTIDGKVTAGEWDAAGVAPGTFTAHDSATPEDPAQPTKVRVGYSVDGLYVLFECTDTLVLAGNGSEYFTGGPAVEGQQQPFTFGGATDYLAIYVDPSDYPDDANNASFYSYSIQAEPAVTAWSETSSYTYTEKGQFGGMKEKYNPPVVDVNGTTWYWGGGGSWELKKSKIVDGETANGYVMEFFIAWSDLDGYFSNYASEILAAVSDIDGDGSDPYYNQFGMMRSFYFDDAGVMNGAPGSGLVTGMPAPGTMWKVQFCRYSQESSVGYVNWVGDTGGFVSRPFGDLEFGTVSPSMVRDAMLHISN